MPSPTPFGFFIFVILLAVTAVAAAEPVELSIAEDGKALQRVIVAEGAGKKTRQAAAELAEYLQRITGATFEVRTGDGSSGLAVGVVTDFPELATDVEFQTDDPLRRDEYLLRTHADGAYLLGASEQAAHLAVWDFLHHLGYRLYFLTDHWEIVPQRPQLRVAVDTVERPDYVTRLAPRGAPWSDDALWNRWRLRNRVTSSFSLRTGHAYGGILRARAEEFAAHPEYYALVDGERRHAGQVDGRGNIKFCISNPQLRKLVTEWAVEKVRANPDQESISMDPSDGGHWCECENCQAMGSVSDLAITLANDVAEEINALGLGPKYVGIYAYNQHSPPPTVKVHPKVIVSVATSFIRGGYTVEQLIEGWAKQEAVLGIRDYHDVFTWSHDQPRKARGGNLAYLKRTIPWFHRQGARFMNSENSDSWGANGLGYWLTARMLWDIDAAESADDLIEDFLVQAFGPAQGPMREFYQLVNQDRGIRSAEDVVARMYRHLQKARQLSGDDAVTARLDDLVLYTRWLELYNTYRDTSGESRQRNFETLWRFTWRIRDRMLVSTRAICDRDRFRDNSVTVPEEARWNVPEEKNPWKESRPFAAAEIATLLEQGIEANQPTILDFEPTEYSEDLVLAAPLQLPEVRPGSRKMNFRGQQSFHTWLPEGRRQIELKVTGGLIAHYRNRGNVKLSLFAEQEATLDPVDQDESVPPEGKEYRVALSTPHAGLHTVEWNDGSDMSRILPPDDLPLTYRSGIEDTFRVSGRWSLYFYVPRGTKVVGGYATTNNGHLLDGDGNEVFSFEEMEQAGHFHVPVAKGQDGKLWKMERCSGARLLMTVPPYLAASPADLLLPREVVTRDAEVSDDGK